MVFSEDQCVVAVTDRDRQRNGGTLFLLCLLIRVKRPVSVFKASTHSSHDTGLPRGWCEYCVCVCAIGGPTGY